MICATDCSTAALSAGACYYSPFMFALAAGCALFLYISYVLPVAAGFLAHGRSWTRMGPWQLGRLYRPLAVVSVLGCVFLIVIGMALMATKLLVAQKDTSNADLTIKVTGYQWKWGYDYIKGEGEGISFFSSLSTPQAQITGSEPKGPNYLLETDTNVVVPVGKKVRVLLTAADVIHAWWVPALTIKQDAIPGFIRDTWFKAEKEGVYYGQCSKICGKDHAFMPIVFRVVSEDKYKEWLAKTSKEFAANSSSIQFADADASALRQ